MRMNFSASWIFRGWITWAFVTLYAQNSFSKSLQCEETQYLRGSKCCNKCKPGSRVLSHCDNFQQTTCVSCNHGEYQPGWTEEKRCLLQRVCDSGKGFMERRENFVAEEPCRCRRGLQCHTINCEFCEKIPICSPGFFVREVDPETTSERKSCAPCKKGFFSADYDMKQCQQWTNCKAGGRNETQPGSAQADAVCGLPAPGTTPSWAIVSVLLVITVLCLLILLLFCYKDKLKLLSVNLRSCVQNLKRTRIQQETLAPLYHSGAAGVPKCTPCEMTKLVYQAPQGPENDPLCTFPTSVPYVRVPLPFTEEMTNKGGVNARKLTGDRREGSAEPEEVSEEEVVSVSPLLAGSCVCVIPVREPLEVGENEDCSQAVSPGTPASCSCGGLDGDRDGEENKKEDKSGGKRAGEGRNGSQENTTSMSETSVASLVSLSSPLLHTPSAILQSSSPPELCLALSQAQVRTQFKCDLPDRSLVKQEGLHRLTNTDSTCTENSLSSAMTSVSPLMTSMSVGNLYLDSPPEASIPERHQGISLGNSRENKFSLGKSELECLPESLHSHLAEPSLTSGLVSGNHNTTFISSGQVMNFSGEVIVVYVSQTSHDSDEGGSDDAFRSPVQEESNETALFFQSSQRSQGDSISHNTLQDETLPVQEVMEERFSDK